MATAEADTPFPIRHVLVLGIILVSNAFSLAFLFPFVSFMVEDFHVTDDDRKLGYYAGFVASAFMLGRMCTSFFWGSWSDKHGRKPVLYIGLLTVVINSVAFGFSWNLPWALATRFLTGFFNGIVGTAKVCVSELCTEKHQARGMSTVSLTWGMGLIIGPAAGGLLSKPAEKYGGFDPDGLFGQFPYLLPSLVAAGIGVIGLMAMPFLPETLHFDAESCSIKEPRAAGAAAVKHKHGFDNDDDEDADVALASDVGRGTATDGARAGYDWRPLTADQDQTAAKPTDVVPEVDEMVTQDSSSDRVRRRRSTSTGGIEMTTTCSNRRRLSSNASSDLIVDDDEDAAGNLEDRFAPTGAVLVDEIDDADDSGGVTKGKGTSTADPAVVPAKPSSWLLLRNRVVVRIISAYAVWSLVMIMLDEVVPLWARLKLEDGGLDMDEQDIGSILAMMGVCLMVYQILLFPMMARRFGPLNLFRYCALMQAPVAFSVPYVNLLPPNLHMAGLTGVMFLRMAVGTNVFTSNFMLINNSVASNQRGAVNGLAMTVGSIGKAVGPALGGVLFAASTASGAGWPLNYHLTFIASGMFSIAVVVISRWFPAALDRSYHLGLGAEASAPTLTSTKELTVASRSDQSTDES